MEIIKEQKENKREHFYLSRDIKDYIYEYGEKNKLNKSKSLESIIKEHREYSKLANKDMYKQIAKNITENLREEYGEEVKKSKQRTQFIDKNVQILIELFNFFLVNNVKENDTILTTDMAKAPILETAEKEIDRRLYENMYRKNNSLD